MRGAFQVKNAGSQDAFVAEIDPSQGGPASLFYSSYIGGVSDDAALGIAVNPLGEAWITGQTGSRDWPTVNPLQAAFGGGSSDAFVIEIARETESADFVVSGAPSSRTIVSGETTTYSVTVTPSGGLVDSIDLSIGGLPPSANAALDPPTLAIVDGSAQSATLTVSTDSSTPLAMYPLIITATGATAEHTASVSLMLTSAANGVDLGLTNVASPNPVDVGTTLTYTLHVVNRGPAAATGVTAIDALPAVVFVSATPSQGTCSGTNPMTGNIGAWRSAPRPRSL